MDCARRTARHRPRHHGLRTPAPRDRSRAAAGAPHPPGGARCAYSGESGPRAPRGGSGLSVPIRVPAAEIRGRYGLTSSADRRRAVTRTLTQHLADFAAQTTFDGLPAEVVHSVELRFLDTLGICLAARTFGLVDGVQKMVQVWSGKPEARLIGADLACPAPNAALVNGTLAHSLDFDDTHLPSVLHPSASIVPAVLAMAEATGRTGADALLAAALGIEVTVRIGMGGYLPEAGNVFFERGWHATSICGTLGAAAAAGRLLGLESEGIMNALGIAASFGSGVIEANRAGGTVKRVHCGWAAHAGLTTALLAHP